MSLIRRLFSKSPADLLAKGDKFMVSDCFFDARSCYEDGLQLCLKKDTADDLREVFTERIYSANRKLAERNLHEAECAYAHGESNKAIDHLELVKTLTYDSELREKAEKLLQDYLLPDDEHVDSVNIASCSSCTGSAGGECADSTVSGDSIPLLEYYELLIQQLPEEQYQRYSELGENFACSYIAASRDEHAEALSGLEKCQGELPDDIYCYEKGKILHRLGNNLEAEQMFRSALQLNGSNSLAWLSLTLFLLEKNCFQEALTAVDAMVSKGMLIEQALMLRAEIYEFSGNRDAAIDQYADLLQTSFARSAAEKLYGLLMEVGRHEDASVVLKKYMRKSCH